MRDSDIIYNRPSPPLRSLVVGEGIQYSRFKTVKLITICNGLKLTISDSSEFEPNNTL